MLSPFLFAIFIDDIGKIQNNRYGTYVILYADDIIVIGQISNNVAENAVVM